MAIWNALRREFDKAGEVAQSAIDEGKLRIELHRTKQRVEAAAAALGFAVYRARSAGSELEPARYDIHAASIAAAEAEVGRIDRAIAALKVPREPEAHGA